MARGVGQCLECRFRVWLKPLGDEVFSFCPEQGERLEKINLEDWLRKGLSPAIDEHLNQGIPCDRFEPGKSISETTREQPFAVASLRQTGEEYLRGILCGAA